MFKLGFIIAVYLYVKIVFSLNLGETIHYTWIGPPPEANPLHSIIGHDYIGPVLTAKQLQNQESKTGIKHEIRFYCLDVFKEHYVELFKEENVDIKVFGVIEFLLSFQNAEDEMLREYSKKFIAYMIKDKNNQRQKLQSTLLNYEQVEINLKNRKSDVALKDKFTLFLFAFERGYIFDTNIVPVGEVILKSYEHYLIPHIPAKAVKDPFNERPESERDLLKILRSLDCFALYAPPGYKTYAFLAFTQIFSETEQNEGCALEGGRALNYAFRNKKIIAESKYNFLNLKKFGLFKFSFETHRKHNSRFEKNYDRPLSKNKIILYITTLQNTKIDSAKKEFWDCHKNCQGKICPCEISTEEIYDKKFHANYLWVSLSNYKIKISGDPETLNYIENMEIKSLLICITCQKYLIETEKQESLLEAQPKEDQETWNTFLIREFLENEKDQYCVSTRLVTPLLIRQFIPGQDDDDIDDEKLKKENSFWEPYYQALPSEENNDDDYFNPLEEGNFDKLFFENENNFDTSKDG